MNLREAVPAGGGAGRLPADYHTHTFRCRHACGDAAAYVAAAERAGVAEIACTDHIPFPNEPDPMYRMVEADFAGYLEAVGQAREGAGIPVLLGMEADFTPELTAAGWVPRLAERAEFDVVLGSVHTGPYWDFKAGDPWLTGDVVAEVWRGYFTRYAEMARSGFYDVGAHFDLPKRRAVFLPEAVQREIVLPALDAVAEAGMALEINTSGLGHPCGEVYPSLCILRWARERGIGLTFGSDAHDPNGVGRGFAEAVALARAAGYEDAVRFRARKPFRVPLG